MSPAEIRFRWLWAALMGRPMFPAKPLTHGGVIQRRPKFETLVKIYKYNDSCELGWRIPGETDREIIAWVTKHSDIHASDNEWNRA